MIIKNDQNILRKKCEDVKVEEVDDLISLLEKELELSSRFGVAGIGLAAPQIGIHKKAAIIRMGEIRLNLMNATLDKMYDEVIFKSEGCLSLPGVEIITKRFNEITVINNLVYPYSLTAKGLTAIAIQHEVDHYNGILMIDREIRKPLKSLNPNDQCFCGSGKKYKKCCRDVKVFV